MNRTVRWIGVGVVFVLSFVVGQGHGQQRPVAAEPQAPSRTAQVPHELVPTLPVPRLVKFAGIFKDEQGQPRTGVVGVTFAIYKDQEGGAPLWMETQNVEVDEQGHYTVLLGATKSEGLPLELFSSGEPRWLGVQVNLPKELEQPRVLLVSVPYALKAADAETVGGMPASAFVLAAPSSTAPGTSVSGSTTPATGNSKTAGKTATSGKTAAPLAPVAANFIPVFLDNAGTLGSSVMTQSGSNIGIGTTSPAGALHVNGDTLLVTSGTTAQVQFSGALSGARFGQDGSGAFFASDTNGKAVRFYTNNGTLNEGLRIDSSSNVGIGTATPTQKLSVAGMIQSTAGGFMFPDATVQSTAAQLPAASLVRAITYLAGCDSCGLLTNADSQNTIFFNLIGSMTINSVTCFSDAGSPTVNIQRNQGGTLTNLLSANLTCSTTGATSSSFSTSVLGLNDSLNFIMATADGVAKRLTVIIKATVN